MKNIDELSPNTQQDIKSLQEQLKYIPSKYPQQRFLESTQEIQQQSTSKKTNNGFIVQEEQQDEINSNYDYSQNQAYQEEVISSNAISQLNSNISLQQDQELENNLDLRSDISDQPSKVQNIIQSLSLNYSNDENKKSQQPNFGSQLTENFSKIIQNSENLTNLQKNNKSSIIIIDQQSKEQENTGIQNSDVIKSEIIEKKPFQRKNQNQQKDIKGQQKLSQKEKLLAERKLQFVQNYVMDAFNVEEQTLQTDEANYLKEQQEFKNNRKDKKIKFLQPIKRIDKNEDNNKLIRQLFEKKKQKDKQIMEKNIQLYVQEQFEKKKPKTIKQQLLLKQEQNQLNSLEKGFNIASNQNVDQKNNIREAQIEQMQIKRKAKMLIKQLENKIQNGQAFLEQTKEQDLFQVEAENQQGDQQLPQQQTTIKKQKLKSPLEEFMEEKKQAAKEKINCLLLEEKRRLKEKEQNGIQMQRETQIKQKQLNSEKMEQEIKIRNKRLQHVKQEKIKEVPSNYYQQEQKELIEREMQNVNQLKQQLKSLNLEKIQLKNQKKLIQEEEEKQERLLMELKSNSNLVVVGNKLVSQGMIPNIPFDEFSSKFCIDLASRIKLKDIVGENQLKIALKEKVISYLNFEGNTTFQIINKFDQALKKQKTSMTEFFQDIFSKQNRRAMDIQQISSILLENKANNILVRSFQNSTQQQKYSNLIQSLSDEIINIFPKRQQELFTCGAISDDIQYHLQKKMTKMWSPLSKQKIKQINLLTKSFTNTSELEQFYLMLNSSEPLLSSNNIKQALKQMNVSYENNKNFQLLTQFFSDTCTRDMIKDQITQEKFLELFKPYLTLELNKNQKQYISSLSKFIYLLNKISFNNQSLPQHQDKKLQIYFRILFQILCKEANETSYLKIQHIGKYLASVAKVIQNFELELSLLNKIQAYFSKEFGIDNKINEQQFVSSFLRPVEIFHLQIYKYQKDIEIVNIFINEIAQKGLTLQQAFEKLDENGDDVLTLKEVKNGILKVLQISTLNDFQTQILVKFMDSDNDGAISKLEFVNAIQTEYDLQKQYVQLLESFLEVSNPIILQEKLLDYKSKCKWYKNQQGMKIYNDFNQQHKQQAIIKKIEEFQSKQEANQIKIQQNVESDTLTFLQKQQSELEKEYHQLKQRLDMNLYSFEIEKKNLKENREQSILKIIHQNNQAFKLKQQLSEITDDIEYQKAQYRHQGKMLELDKANALTQINYNRWHQKTLKRIRKFFNVIKIQRFMRKKFKFLNYIQKKQEKEQEQENQNQQEKNLQKDDRLKSQNIFFQEKNEELIKGDQELPHQPIKIEQKQKEEKHNDYQTLQNPLEIIKNQEFKNYIPFLKCRQKPLNNLTFCDNMVTIICKICKDMLFCSSCFQQFHKGAERKNHNYLEIEQFQARPNKITPSQKHDFDEQLYKDIISLFEKNQILILFNKLKEKDQIKVGLLEQNIFINFLLKFLKSNENQFKYEYISLKLGELLTKLSQYFLYLVNNEGLEYFISQNSIIQLKKDKQFTIFVKYEEMFIFLLNQIQNSQQF